jgi:hypothetical protein
MYSDLKDSLSMLSLHSSESLRSVVIPIQTQTFNELIHFEPRNEQLSSITDLDETIKSQKLHMATEIVERYDEGVFDDGITSQNEEDENNSVVIADSDDEDEIEHFDSTDSIIGAVENVQQQSNDYVIQTNLDNSNNTSTEAQTINLGRKSFVRKQRIKSIELFLDMYEEEVYDNVKSNNENDNNTLRNFSDA